VRPPERREVDAELLRLVEEAAKEAPEARGVVERDGNQEEIGCCQKTNDEWGYHQEIGF